MNTQSTLFCFSLLLISLTALTNHPNSNDNQKTMNNKNKKYYIISDLDDVLIEKSYFHSCNIVLNGIWKDPLNTATFLATLNNLRLRWVKHGLEPREMLDNERQPINGLTFCLLYFGMENKKFAPYAKNMLKTSHSSRSFIQGTKELYIKLNKKNIPIIIATNKDRISYDMTVETFGKELENIAEKVFVAHPINNKVLLNQLENYSRNNPKAPKDYLDILNTTLTIQPTNTIHHVPSKKPNQQYYRYIFNTINKLDEDTEIIFIDDKKKNVANFLLTAQEFYKPSQIHSIHFKNPHQLAQELIKIGVLQQDS